MRGRWLLGVGVAVAAVVMIAGFSGCTTILGTFDVAPATTDKGAACKVGTDCGTGFCADGVCCESACSGTCEACNLPGSLGTCAPVPDGQNPANECPTAPLEDAGTPTGNEPETDAGEVDGGDAGATTVKASPSYGFPDGGITTDDNKCAGTCNGARACRYPGSETTCGTTFCSSFPQQGRASCDTKGHCSVGGEQCEAYGCPEGAPGCLKTCAGDADCLATHFCDTASSTCKPKLANAAVCTLSTQCQNGHCVDGVCCNDECSGFPGATCKKAGHIGECQCDACDQGTCQLYYQDQDGDGYGDNTGTVANARAKPGCVGVPPAGFVADNTDCLDGPKTSPYTDVHPGQTGWFSGTYVGHSGSSFDYDCSATEDKQFPEYPGQSCGFCGYSNGLFCGKSSTCGTAGANAGLDCSFGFGGGCTGKFCYLTCQTDGQNGGFTANVPCGGSGSYVDCGACSASGGGSVGNSYSTQTQRCH